MGSKASTPGNAWESDKGWRKGVCLGHGGLTHIPCALHHIMVRGINKSTIFKDDEDKSRFLQRLDENVSKAGASIYAWVLNLPMPASLHRFV